MSGTTIRASQTPKEARERLIGGAAADDRDPLQRITGDVDDSGLTTLLADLQGEGLIAQGSGTTASSYSLGTNGAVNQGTCP